MKEPRFSLEEFNVLFPGKSGSQQERQRQYDSFLVLLEQLDQAPVPELPAAEKAAIFRRSWPRQSRDRSAVRAWLASLRRLAAVFALGVALGCVLMFVWMNDRADRPEPPSAQPALTVEHTRYTQTYAGKVIEALYPRIENPRIVLERTEQPSPKRVLYGTLNHGEIYVVWNL